jgi:hypothetical protein
MGGECKLIISGGLMNQHDKVGNNVLEHIKHYWIPYCIVMSIIGVIGRVYSSSYTLLPREMNCIVDGKISKTSYYIPQVEYPIIDVLSNIMFSISVAMLISLLFIRALEKSDKDKFESKLLDIQKNIAENAFVALFDQIVERPFFDQFKDDILKSNFIRKNIRWHYDFKICGDKLILKRTVNYHLQNNSTTVKSEEIKTSCFESIHCKTSTMSTKYRLNTNAEFIDANLATQTGSAFVKSTFGLVEISPQQNVEFVTIIEQLFNTNYAYETHFFTHSSIDLELTVNIPDGYDFSIDSYALRDRTELIVNEPSKKVFKINGAIFKGQGVEFLCYPEILS